MPQPNARTLYLSALRALDKRAWIAAIRAAFEREPSIPRAAGLLGIGRRTLDRWVADAPELTRGIELVGPGRPYPDKVKVASDVATLANALASVKPKGNPSEARQGGHKRSQKAAGRGKGASRKQARI